MFQTSNRIVTLSNRKRVIQGKKAEKEKSLNACFIRLLGFFCFVVFQLLCTRGGNRTRTSLLKLDFESSASTNSATRAFL